MSCVVQFCQVVCNAKLSVFTYIISATRRCHGKRPNSNRLFEKTRAKSISGIEAVIHIRRKVEVNKAMESYQ